MGPSLKMPRIIFRILFLITLFTISLFAQTQETGNLRGFVTDSTTTEALAYGNVFIKELGIGASTDSRGYFLIASAPSDRNLTLVVSYVGYVTKHIPIRLIKNRVTHYDIILSPSSVELQTIEKIGERIIEKNETDISLQRIIARDLEALPKGVETDIFRSIQYLPGVQSTGDVSARYYVRGGASNQNLVLVDGVTVYNPFHALGLFSVIDPDMINNVEFYKGGFSADLGGRLSSVMKVNTKDGNKNRLSVKGTASFLTGKFLLEGPIPNGSFILTGRKTYSNEVLKKFLNKQSVPIDFYDFSLKANYSSPDFIQGGKFSINGFFSGDNILSEDPRIEDFKWSNNIFGFKWFQVGDSPLFYELGVSISNFKGDVIPKLSNVRQSRNKVEDVSLTMDFTYMFDNKDEIGVGFHVKQVKTDLFLENDRGVPTNLGTSAANITFYTKYKLMQWEMLGLDVGARMNLTTLSRNKKATFIEPRVSFTYRLIPEIAIKGAWGIYQQDLVTISDEDEIISLFEPWIISPDYLIPSNSTHYILGLEIKPYHFFTFSVEGYYKRVKNLPLLNEEKILPADPDFLAGNGESYGLELMTRATPNPINFTASYTLAYAYKELEGLRYYPRYDIRHTLNLGLEINFGAGWSASTVWTYNSGLPFTQLLGYYDKYYFSNIFAPWNELDPRRPFTIIEIQNLGRLPDYHRLDFTVSKKFVIDFLKFDVDISVINVYDRQNIFYFKRNNGEQVNMLPFLPTATIKVEL